MNINQIIGIILLILGIILISIGIYGLYKYRDFYIRATIASLIDTAGFISVSLGIMVYKGISMFTFKVGIIIILMILLNPLSTHIIVRCASSSSYIPHK